MPDTLTPLVRALLVCLCERLALAGRPVCGCCLAHNQAVPAADGCDCDCPVTLPGGGTAIGRGQAWARVVSVGVAPQPFDTPAGCLILQWRATVELGVYRCVSVGGPNGEPPTCAQREADAVAAWADGQVMRETVECCPALDPADARLTVESWLPSGPSGGCAGSVLRFTVDVPRS